MFKLKNQFSCVLPLVAGLTSFTSQAALFPLTITDAAGIKHRFERAPKIGCYWLGCVQTLAGMGLKPQASAWVTKEERSSTFSYPLGLPKYTIFDALNPEDWAAAEVDVILNRVPFGQNSLTLSSAAPVFHLHNPNHQTTDQKGYRAYIENIRLISLLTGETEKGASAIRRFDNVLTRLKTLANDQTRQLTVAVVNSSQGYRLQKTDSSFCSALVDLGFGKCIGSTKESRELNGEMFLKLDPDWIIYETGQSYKKRKDPLWQRLKAVSKGQIYNTTGYSYSCCSTQSLTHSLQDYAHRVVSAEVPSAGPMHDFVAINSPLTHDLSQ